MVHAGLKNSGIDEETNRTRKQPEPDAGKGPPSTQEVTVWTVAVLQEIDELTIPSSSLSVSDMLKGKATFVHVHNAFLPLVIESDCGRDI